MTALHLHLKEDGPRQSTTLSATRRRAPCKASTRAATSAGTPLRASMNEASSQVMSGSRIRVRSTREAVRWSVRGVMPKQWPAGAGR
jgi:hypothetical protein